MTKKSKNLIASLQSIDNTFLDLLQEFPADLVASAQEFEAFRRGRQIKNVAQLFQVVMLYCGLDYSLRQTAGTLALLGIRVSDQAVSDRLGGCALWLTHLLKQMLPPLPPEAAQMSGRWILIDGSTIQVLGARGTSYRLHLAWDWVSQTIVEWIITDEKTGESLKLYKLQTGDTLIADRGYARAKDILYVLEQEGEMIVRVAPQILPLIDLATGNGLKLADELWATDEAQVSRKVALKADEKRQEMYLHAYRLPPAKAAEARRRKIARARSNGITLKKETLEYADWLMVITSYAPDEVRAEEIGRLYRLRWQIEIVIKRLKSVLEIDRLRATKGSRLAEVYLLGKSLYALLIAKRSGELKSVEECAWRVWKMIREEINVQISQVPCWKKEHLAQAIKQMKERKRHRKRQMEAASELISKLLSTT